MKPRLVANAAQLLFRLVLASDDCDDENATAALTFTSPGQITSVSGTPCPTIWASINIEADVLEDLDLDGVDTIQGDLVLNKCQSSGCANKVTKFSSSTLRVVNGNLEIEDVDTLEEISFPALTEALGSASVKNLKSLDTLNIEALGTVGNLSVADVEQLYYLNLSTAGAENLSIAGNGELVLVLGNMTATNDPFSTLIERLDISGVGEVRWGTSTRDFTVQNFSIHDSKIEELPLLFSKIQNIEVRDNNQLTDLLFPTNETVHTKLLSQVKNITITRNEKLNLTTIHTGKWNSTDMLSWVWPSNNVDSIVLEGIIHNTFFEPLMAANLNTTLDNADLSKQRVLQNFTITSTASTFHCEPIDELRRHGVFPGNYSCNGDDIDIPSNSSSVRDGEGLLREVLLVMAAGLLILL